MAYGLKACSCHPLNLWNSNRVAKLKKKPCQQRHNTQLMQWLHKNKNHKTTPHILAHPYTQTHAQTPNTKSPHTSAHFTHHARWWISTTFEVNHHLLQVCWPVHITRANTAYAGQGNRVWHPMTIDRKTNNNCENEANCCSGKA